MICRPLFPFAVVTAFAVALLACGAPNAPDFTAQAAMTNLYLIESGKIAAEKGQSDAVKEFGRHIAEQHAKFNQELASIVQKEKLAVTLPVALDEKGESKIKALTDAKSGDFDALYIKQQVNALKRSVNLFDTYAEGGDNEGLKQFAANVLLALKRNRDRAKKLAR